MSAGYCSRPFLVVPNQTYKQWISEIEGILPHLPINDLYNLSAEYIEALKDADGNISLMAATVVGRTIGVNDGQNRS